MNTNMSPEEMGRIWDRVAPPPPPPPPPSCEGKAAELARALDEAACLKGRYMGMSRKTGRRQESETLRAMARDEAGAERALMRELFVLTGETRHPKRCPYRDDGLLGGIRDAIMREERFEAALLRAGQCGLRPQSAERYRLLIRSSRRHRERLEAMLDRIIR